MMLDRSNAPGPDETAATYAPLFAAIRSDALATWHALLRDFPALCRAFGVPNQVRLVIDANIVIADLRWLAVKRTSPAARTVLEEVIASGTVVAYVPGFLHEEVEKHLPRIADEAGVPVARLVELWTAYRAILRSVDMPSSRSARGRAPARDPKDLPYIELQVAVAAAAVYTNDTDITAMQAPVVGPSVLTAARGYARSASISFTIRFGGVLVVSASLLALTAVAWLATALATRIRELPEWVQVFLLGATVAALARPATREWLLERTHRLAPGARELLRGLVPMVLDATERARAAQRDADVAWTQVRSALPATAPVLDHHPVRVHVLAACIAAGRPLSLTEIAADVRAQGFRGGQTPSLAYLRTVLRTHPSLSRTTTGHWVPSTP